MIDLVFEASIAEVLDDHLSDERLKTALFGQGIIGTWGGPREPGTASIKLMHFQGDMDGRGPLWGYVQGGMGMVSFAIADAAREAGATLACGVTVSEIVPGEGVTLEDGTLDPGRHGDLERRPQANPRHARRLRGRCRVPRPARGLEGAKSRGQVQRRARPAADLDRRARRGRGRRGRRSTSTGTIDEAQRAFEAAARGEPAVGFGEIYIQTGYDPSPLPRESTC